MNRHRVAVLLTTALLVAACGSSSLAASAGPTAAPSAPSSATSASPPAVASSSPASSPAAFRVVGLEVRADPADHIGACPLKITFSGRISVAGGPGTVSYKWISSDGDTSPVKTLAFAGPGSRDVSSDWTVDRDTVPTHAGWSSIEITAPVSVPSADASSKSADFTFTCDKDDDIEAIGFGLAGSNADCSFAKSMRTFAPTDPVRMIANYWPSLPAGTVVTFRLSRDGVLVDHYPVTTTLHQSSKCVHGNISPGTLPVGHYRLDVIPDTARAVSGEFDTK